MGKLFGIITLGFCLSCSHTEKPAETVVLKYTWVWCWNQCGKGDKLVSVSNSACVCSNGGVIPLQPQHPPETLPPTPSLVERLIGFFKE